MGQDDTVEAASGQALQDLAVKTGVVYSKTWMHTNICTDIPG
jgi:hypothetical protein